MAGPSPRRKGLRRLLMSKGVVLAVLVFGAPALAAVVISRGDRSTSDVRGVAMMRVVQAGVKNILAQAGVVSSSIPQVVSSEQELRRELEVARDGSVIRLAAGHYPSITLSGIRKEGVVTITAADPIRPPIIARLTIRNSAGLTLQGIELAADASAAPPLAPGELAGGGDGLTREERLKQWRARQKAKAAGPENRHAPAPRQDERRGEGGGGLARFPFLLVNSERIALDRLYVHGPLDNASAAYRIPAIMIRASQHITVSNSTFSSLWHGIAMLDLDGVVIVRNEFSNIRTDGIRGGGISNAEIANNILTDFKPAPGDHPDGIQLWSTPQKTIMANISIHDNLIVRGAGGPTQGIFLRDVRDSLLFRNVSVTDNLVMGSLYNGIALNGVDQGIVLRNEVVNYPDRPRSWIRLDYTRGVVMRDNRASKFTVTRSEVEQSNNKEVMTKAVDERARVAQWLGAKPGRQRSDSRLQQILIRGAAR